MRILVHLYLNTITDNTIIFLDPPYLLDNSKLYGNNGDLHEHFDHVNLSNILKQSNVDWIMTYNNSPKIRQLYSEFKIIECDWSYSMNKSKQSSEIIILSKKNSMKDDITNTINNSIDIYINNISSIYNIDKDKLLSIWNDL